MTLPEYLEIRRREVDEALARFLPPADECPPVLGDAMSYSLLAGGKRLRPILCLASAEAVGGDHRDAMSTACAIEFIHTYSLIHDDLPAMDNDTMRRGRPTLHVVAGEGMAILAGDGLLTDAFRLIANDRRTNDPELLDRKLGVIEMLASAAGPRGMVGGQALDLASVTPDAEGRLPPPLDAHELRRMHGKKTGALIVVAATCGAVLGGGSNAQLMAIGEAAAEFGLAFQIVDDILDVEGASAALGKTAGKDAAAGKSTYPALYGLETSRRMAAECLERADAFLRAEGLADTHLLGIGRWIVGRSS
jgi:geranylgeranyl diphosphate synthase type II